MSLIKISLLVVVAMAPSPQKTEIESPPAPTTPISDQEIEKALDAFWAGLRSEQSFEEVEAEALTLEHAGIQRNDDYLQARGLAMRALVDLDHAKWNNGAVKKLKLARKLTGGDKHLQTETLGPDHALARSDVLSIHGYCKAMWLQPKTTSGKADLRRAIVLAWSTEDDRLLATTHLLAFGIENLSSRNLLSMKYAILAEHYAKATDSEALIEFTRHALLRAHDGIGLEGTEAYKELLLDTITSFDEETKAYQISKALLNQGRDMVPFWEEFGANVDDKIKQKIPINEIGDFIGNCLKYMSYVEFEVLNQDRERMLMLSEYCLHQAKEIGDTRLYAISHSRKANWLYECGKLDELIEFGTEVVPKLSKSGNFDVAKAITRKVIQAFQSLGNRVQVLEWKRNLRRLNEQAYAPPIEAMRLSSINDISINKAIRSSRESERFSILAVEKAKQREIVQSLELASQQTLTERMRSRFWLVAFGLAVSTLGLLCGLSWVNSSSVHRLNEQQKNEMEQRNNFIAMLSHELRNPMATILHAVELEKQLATFQSAQLPKTAPTEAPIESRNFDLVIRQTEHMSRLLNCMLDVAKFKSGKLDVKLQKVDLVDVLADVAANIEFLAKQKGQTFNVICNEPSVLVQADGDRMLQAQVNLLVNAIKFSPVGSTIQLQLKCVDGNAEIEVKDDGPGIPINSQKRIFELFFQGENSIYRSESGMGIGLSLATDIVRMHNGILELYSTGPKGSIFKITIPLDKSTVVKEKQKRVA